MKTAPVNSASRRTLRSTLGALPRAAQKEHPVAQHRGQLLHSIEQFATLLHLGVLQALDDERQIQADGFDRFFQRAPFLPGGALRFASSPDLSKVNYLRHNN